MLRNVFPRVAVIDSGWNSARDDQRVLPGTSVRERPDGTIAFTADTHDEIGHGTACGTRILLMCPHARLIPIKIFRHDLGATGQELLAALRWAHVARVDIVSLSLTCKVDQEINELRKVCNELVESGTHIVAAADNVTGRGVPAEFASVIGVRATKRRGIADVAFSDNTSIECHADGFLPAAHWGSRSFNSIAAATVSGFVAAMQVSLGMLTTTALRNAMARVCESTMPEAAVWFGRPQAGEVSPS